MDIESSADEVLISLALEEDLSARGDVTSQALIDELQVSTVSLVSREPGVLSGVLLATKVYKTLDPDLSIEWMHHDGDYIDSGEVLVRVEGSYRALLAAERTALNFLQHLSGISTMTKKFVDILQRSGSSTVVRDTRKTLPGYRAHEKKAVVHGGGHNHRMGLYDAFLVKDNHIAARNLAIIAKRCREYDPTLPLEIEVDTLEQLQTIVQYEPDVILLDNFSVDDVYRAIDLSNGIDLEISGGITLHNVEAYGATNVKYMAVGALTHSARALDIGCDMYE